MRSFLWYTFRMACVTLSATYSLQGLAIDQVCHDTLRILTGKKQPQIKLERFQEVWIWTSGWLVDQINSLCEGLKLKQNFQKTKIVTGKCPFYVIGPSCTPHSICLNIGFWQGSFAWKHCVFNANTFNKKTVLKFFEKLFAFFRVKALKVFKISINFHIKISRFLKRRLI